MPNYDYANSTGLSVLSQKIFEHLSTNLNLKADKATTYTKTDVDGLFDGKGLVDIEEGTDSEPYLFKATPFGDRLYEKIIGGSVAWNQLVPNSSIHLTVTVPNDITTNTWGADIVSLGASMVGHKVLTVCNLSDPKCSIAWNANAALFANRNNRNVYIATSEMIGSVGSISWRYLAGLSAGTYTADIQFFDLTQMFGSTIADYIYNLEQTTAGAGVAFFRKLFPKSYYPYDAGSIQSVKTSAHVMSGKNLVNPNDTVVREGYPPISVTYNDGVLSFSGWSSGNRFIAFVMPVQKGEKYTVSYTFGANLSVKFYDTRPTVAQIYTGTFIASGNYAIATGNWLAVQAEITSGNEIITNLQVELGASKTAYAPYIQHSYPLDSSLTLRGIPKLDKNNKLYYDGDTYEADGTVTRRYGIVDLGTISWEYATSQTTGISRFQGSLSYAKGSGANNVAGNILCPLFMTKAWDAVTAVVNDKTIAVLSDGGIIAVQNSAYTDVATFKAAMSGVYLVYELATPTIESAHPFQSPQRVTEGGTEEYVTTGIVPVGHESTYVINKAERFDAMPDVAPLDGDYIVRQRSGAMNLVDVEDYAGFVESDTGNPITIETDAAQYAKNTHLTLEPVQDLHGYDHPWAGGAGKNLFNYDAWKGLSITRGTAVFENNGVTLTATSNDAYTDYSSESYPTNARIPISEGETVTLTWETTETASLGAVYIFPNTGSFVNENSNVGSLSYTGTTGVSSISIRVGVAASGNTVHYKNIMVRKSGDATFEPYSNICPITPMGHRNLLPMTVEGIKAANTSGTWSGNVYTINGGTFTILTDNDGNVAGIKANGTFNATTIVRISSDIPLIQGGAYKLNGCTLDTNNCRLDLTGNTSGSESYVNIVGDTSFMAGQSSFRLSLIINSGYQTSNIMLYPMLRLASDPDSTFVPYGMARIGAKVTGKNLFNIGAFSSATDNGITVANVGDGSILISGTSTSVLSQIIIAQNQKLPAGTYTISYNNDATSGYTRLQFNDNNNNAIDSRWYIDAKNKAYTFTLRKETYFDIRVVVTNGAQVNALITPQLELGSTATAYEPYTEYTASLDLPEPVYSGTLDLETGELVSDMASVDINEFESQNATSGGGLYYYDYNSSTIKINGNAVCNMLEVNNSTAWAYTTPVLQDSSSANRLRIYDNVSTASALREKYAGIQIVYELATPITYQLTPQQLALFKGTSNISTNAKTVQVTYRNGELATTGDIVESTEVAKRSILGEAASDTDAKLATSLAPILGNFASAETSPASASHAVGEYLLYNNRLYKVLAAISAGQQLTIGTNIGQTNVAAELASLNIKQTVNTGITGVYAYTLGRVVYIRFYDCPYNVTGTLPESVRPLNQVHFALVHNPSFKACLGAIAPNGTITLSSDITSGYVYGEAVYFLG